MFQWIINLLGSGIFQIFGTSILQPVLAAWAASKNVDLAKFQATDATIAQMTSAVLAADVQYEAQKLGLITTVLGWWPFRVILFALLFFPAMHFCLIVLDSTFTFGSGHYGTLGIPGIPKPYNEYEREFLLFFIITKPVDTLISGAFGAVTQYFHKK